MSAEIVSHYWVRARLDSSFHPVRKELFDMDLCSTWEGAEKALDAINRHG